MYQDRQEPTPAELAHWIRTRRRAEMLTQQQLAERAGLSVRTVRYLEAGQHSAPRSQTRRLVVAALSGGLTGGQASPVPAQLPPDTPDFVGRDVAMRQLDDLLGSLGGPARHAPMLVVLVGPLGAGKTALAVHWAHRSRSWFVDGQVFLDLGGSARGRDPVSPAECLSRVLQALGVSRRDIPSDPATAQALYRTLLADRRMLMLFDDASSAEQVRPLVPGGAGNVVLVTSRDGLAGLVVRAGAVRIPVEGLEEDQACSLLARILGADRARAEPEALAAVARQCGYLPLVLRLAAATLDGRPGQAVSDYADAIRRQGLSRTLDDSTDVDVRTILESLRLPPP
jgi:transcriptional regulator with XRE-family HTH domain